MASLCLHSTRPLTSPVLRGIFSSFGWRSSSAVGPKGGGDGGGDEGDAASHGSRGSTGSGKLGTEDDGSTLGSVPGLFGHALEAAAAKVVAPAKKPPKPIDPEKLEACHAAFFEWFGLARPYDLSAAQHAKLRDDVAFAALEVVSYVLAWWCCCCVSPALRAPSCRMTLRVYWAEA